MSPILIVVLHAAAFTCIVSGISVIFASLAEWTLHRFLMHRRVRIFAYPFEKHAMIHHQVFKADETYHLIHEKDKMTIPMAWWNGFVLALVGTLPFAALSFCFWYHPFLITWDAFITIYAYYGVYEYLHWCMHLPRWRRLEFTRVFQWLNGHHLLHHRNMGTNFNVVLPLFDLFFGTLIVRATTRFKQASGYAVPDVQPFDVSAAKTEVFAKRKRPIVFLEAP